MHPSQPPNFRSAIIAAYLVNAPALLIALACAYGGICVVPWLFFGTAVMGFVFAGNLYTQLQQIKRATALVTRTQPVPMQLTTNRGWSEVRLQPVQPNSGLLTISNIRFVTRLSGLSLTEQQGTPVQVYLDSVDPDVVVLRIGDRLLSSDISFRYSGNDDSGPKREYAPDAVTALPSAPVQSTGQLCEGIERLAAENRMTIIMVLVAGIAMFVFVLFLTGSWRIVQELEALRAAPFHVLESLFFPLLVAAVFIYLLITLFRMKQQVLCGIKVVKCTQPVSQVLHVAVLGNTDQQKNTWLVTIGAESPAPYVLKLLVNMNQTRANAISGTIGQVYATTNPDDPVVIQTGNGILVGKRHATPPKVEAASG